MLNKLALENWPAGVPAEIDPDAFGSIPAMLETLTARFADRPRSRITWSSAPPCR